MMTKKTPSKRPKVEPSKAVIGKMNVSNLMAIDPGSTPVSAYTKRTK